MSEPKPVAWMAEWTWPNGDDDFNIVRSHEAALQTAEAHPGANVIPLYPGPFRVEWGILQGDDGLVSDMPVPMHSEGAARKVAKANGQWPFRRLVSEWEPDRG